MSRRRRHQQFDACSRLFMPSPCAAVLHIRRHDVSRRRQCARRRQVGDTPGPVHPSCLSADFRLLRSATNRWDGLDSCPSPAQFVRHTGRTSSGECVAVSTPVCQRADVYNSLRRSSYVAACVLIMRSHVGSV